MVIYIPMEIPVRELPGYLLFSAAAASRGHKVLITTGVDLWLYKRLQLLTKGCYLLKNMNVPSVSKIVYDGFLENGYDLYCHEQEASIIFGEFSSHLNVLGIKRNQAVPFTSVFCWGRRDTYEYGKYFESVKDVFFDIGSVRLELWKKKYVGLWQKESTAVRKAYILAISNFSYTMGDRHWSEISLTHRLLEMLNSAHEEEQFINTIAQECNICCEFIIAVKRIARERPNLEVVFRPHPADAEINWENIFCNDENVTVIGNSDSISPWIQNAKMIMHNGCTSAIEAVIREVPIVSYGPDRVHDDLTIPNQLGVRAKNLDELNQALSVALDPQSYREFHAASELAIDTIVSVDKDNAAFDMVSIMEKKSSKLIEGDLSIIQIYLIKAAKILKSTYDLIRNVVGGSKLEAHSSYCLEKRQLQKDLKIMSEVLDVPEPKVTLVSKNCLLIS